MKLFKNKFVTSLLLFLVTFSTLVFAGDSYYERAVIDFKDMDWIVGHASSTPAMTLVEYIPAGQEIDDWQELFSTYFVRRSGNNKMSAIEYADYAKLSIEEMCNNNSWEIIESDFTGIYTIYNVSTCDSPGEAEYCIARFFDGIQGVHHVYYSTKDKSLFESSMYKWLEILKSTEAFHRVTPEAFSKTGKWAANNKMMYVELSPVDSDYLVKIWRSGRMLMRMEDLPNDGSGRSLLTIANAPDSWKIDPMKKKGIHSVDMSTNIGAAHPVLGVVEPLEITKFFETGDELTFFESMRALKVGAEFIDDVMCILYELPIESKVLRLWVKVDNEIPFQASVVDQNGNELKVRYLKYITGLSKDLTLFAPATDIEIKSSR